MIGIRKLLPYGFLFLLAILLEYIYFRGFEIGEFIFSSDQLFWFSYHEAFGGSYFLRKMDHLGVFNSWQFVVQFWDTLYHLILYRFQTPLLSVEKFSFFLTFFFSFSAAYFGFRKVSLLFRQEERLYPLLAVTLWYCLNPYTLILWHGGIYNFGLALTYALAPLIIYYFHVSIFTESKLRTRIICAILLFFASFVFWLFAVIVFFLFWYTILYLLFTKTAYQLFIKNAFKLLILYVPVVSFVLFLIFHEYANNAGDLNTEYLPTFGNQMGGMWYQFLMIFSWGIYTVWIPRTLFPFGDYFLSIPYMIITLSIYGLILVGGYYILRDQLRNRAVDKWSRFKNVLSNRDYTLYFIFLTLLVISVFFAKGAQAPLGDVFLYLYNHVPFFSVFRSADHRFGFAVVLAVAMLLLFISRRFNAKLFSAVLALLMVTQSYPLFTGTAIRGEEIEEKYFDRIIHIPEDSQALADFLNARKDTTSYVLVLPSIQYGRYPLDRASREEYVGQDLLPKIINKPFVYASVSTGMSRASEGKLQSALERKDYQELREFPIRYLILRSDISCADCATIKKAQAEKEFAKIYQSKSFTVYEITDSLPLVSVPQASFSMINPTRFLVRLHNLKQEDLHFGLSFHKGWKMYVNKKDEIQVCAKGDSSVNSSSTECETKKRFLVGDEWSYLFKPSIFEESHQLSLGYGNAWTLDAETIEKNYNKDYYIKNDDGTIDVTLSLYYQPQSWLYVYALISLLSIVASIGYLKFSSRDTNK